MGLGKKLGNKAKESVGKIKEKTGEATGNDRLRIEGLKDRTVATAK